MTQLRNRHQELSPYTHVPAEDSQHQDRVSLGDDTLAQSLPFNQSDGLEWPVSAQFQSPIDYNGWSPDQLNPQPIYVFPEYAEPPLIPLPSQSELVLSERAVPQLSRLAMPLVSNIEDSLSQTTAETYGCSDYLSQEPKEQFGFLPSTALEEEPDKSKSNEILASLNWQNVPHSSSGDDDNEKEEDCCLSTTICMTKFPIPNYIPTTPPLLRVASTLLLLPPPPPPLTSPLPAAGAAGAATANQVVQPPPPPPLQPLTTVMPPELGPGAQSLLSPRFMCPRLECCQKQISFRRRSDCDRHIRKHDDRARVYNCREPGCKKVFYRKDKLTDHSQKRHQLMGGRHTRRRAGTANPTE